MNAPNPQAGAMLPAVQAPNEVIRMGMDTVQGFEALQRAANLLSASSIVPESYRRFTVNKEGDRIENPNGLPNCVVALNMASRMGADPILIMQNLHVIEGRPSWSSIFIIASINQCGRFSPLRFDLSEPGDETEVEYQFTEWGDDPNRPGKRKALDRVGKVKIRPRTCRAWAVEKATGTRIEGPEVSMQLAIDEGWIQRKGSKWRTMPEVMLRYRAASLFGKLYAPELLMGLQSREELEDVFDVIDAETGEVQTVRTKVRDVTPRPAAAPAGMPTGLGSWTVEQLDELEELLEKATKAIRDAGFPEESSKFEAKIRASRATSDPEKALADLRSQVAELTAPKAAAPADPPPAGAAAAPPAAEQKARGGSKKEAPAGDGSLFQGEKA